MNQGILGLLVGKRHTWHSIYNHMGPQLKVTRTIQKAFLCPKLCPYSNWKMLFPFICIGIWSQILTSIKQPRRDSAPPWGFLQLGKRDLSHKGAGSGSWQPTGAHGEVGGREGKGIGRVLTVSAPSTVPPEIKLWQHCSLNWYISIIRRVRLANSILEILVPISTSGIEIHRNCYSFQLSNRIVNTTFTGLDRAIKPGREVAFEGKILHQGNWD